MKKWVLSLLAAMLVLTALVGSVNAAPPKAVSITAITENIAPGHVVLKTAAVTNLGTVNANVTIKGMKVTWKAESKSNSSKVFYGIINKAVIKKDYTFTIGKAFTLAKGVDAKVSWKEEMIEIDFNSFHFLSNPGEFMFSTVKAVKVEQLKGKIKINNIIASVEAGPEGAGKLWIAKVPGLKAGVDYNIEFLAPLNGGIMPAQWEKQATFFMNPVLDAAAGTIQVSFAAPPSDPITAEHFILEAYLNGEPVEVEVLSYQNGVLSFKPIVKANAEDALMIIIKGNPELMMSGFAQLFG